jgi:hypothetical protein
MYVLWFELHFIVFRCWVQLAAIQFHEVETVFQNVRLKFLQLCLIILRLKLILERLFFLSPEALQSLKDLGRLTYRRFLELFRHVLGLLGRVINPSQGLYQHWTTQHRKTRTNIHALSGIQTHYPSNQPAKTHASDRMATVTGDIGK